MNEEIRRRVMKRYQAMGARPWRPSRHQFRFHVQHLIWLAFVVGARLAKRVVDILGSAFLLIALSPLLVAIAVLIKLESRGPVLFKQIRVGKWGQTFGMYKFRSMHQDAERRREFLQEKNEVPGGVIFKLKRDPRITRVGRFMRRNSIDELPQLLNVLIGEMSLVGPRPALPSEVKMYTLAARQRLDVIPGITCIWQVSGRSEIPFDEQVTLDVAYIETQSFWLDIKLMLKTVPAVLSGRGAY
jgi:lipopolysaccharide/colanic/teichoic acid biosynthesis glycosyltransferase